MLQLFGRLGHELGAKSVQRVELLARVHADSLGTLAHQVAQHALQQIEVLVQQAGRRQAQAGVFNARPGLAQIGDVVGDFAVLCVFGVGAQNKAAAGATGQGQHALTQVFSLFQRYFLRYANVVILRQKNQQAPCHADLRGQARALGAHRVFDHLHHQRLAFKDLAFDRNLRLGRARRAKRLALSGLVPDVSHMQKGCALQPDINKSRLHTRQHPRDLAHIHITHQAALQGALYVQLLHRAVLDDGHARLLRRPVDQNVLLHRITRWWFRPPVPAAPEPSQTRAAP